jgi:hypothetical protein
MTMSIYRLDQHSHNVTMTRSIQRLDLHLAVLICTVALTRLLPHWPNATPIFAIALAAGSLHANRMLAYAVPVLAMILSDAALGLIAGWEYAFHSTQLVVYTCVLGTVGLGHLFKGQRHTTIVLGAGTAASVGFFLVTNLAVWLGSTMYPQTLDGLLACYGAGLAFYNNQGSFFLNGLVSTWAFATVIFAVFNLLNRLNNKALNAYQSN